MHYSFLEVRVTFDKSEAVEIISYSLVLLHKNISKVGFKGRNI